MVKQPANVGVHRAPQAKKKAAKSAAPKSAAPKTAAPKPAAKKKAAKGKAADTTRIGGGPPGLSRR